MMNLYSALELGKNSMLAQQQVFQLIGHNIANVNTEGYSRQVAYMESVRPSVIGLTDGGRGVQLTNIFAVRDKFIDSQIIDRQQYKGKNETMSSIMSTIETLFDESSGLGISDSLTNFFSAWNDLANNPTDIPTRNSLVSKTTSFTSSINNTYQRLIDQQEIYDQNVGVLVEDINSIADEIAQLNEKIAYAEGTGVPANDLVDTRQRRINELSEKIGINVYYEQSTNSATIEVAGRPLVSFNQVNHLSVQRNTYNSNYYDLYMDQYGQPAYDITTSVNTGQMAALIEARDGSVVSGPGTISSVTSLAGQTTLTFSQDHGLSVGDLITINGETRSVSLITASNGIVVDDFTDPVTVGSGWQTRQGYIPEYKNQLDKLATGLIYTVNSMHQTGYTLNGTTGQNFFQMNTGTVNISSIANGSPSAGYDTITFATSPNLSVGDVITINGETRLILSSTGTAVTVSSFATTPVVPALPATLSWEYAQVHGAASMLAVDSNVAADSNLIAASSTNTTGVGGAVGNNTIALQIARLTDANSTVDTNNDGVTDYGTFHEYLHSMFAEIGNAGSTAQYEAEANSSMLTYLQDKRDSISGVSLDEEAANLMQYEKSFQALGKFMGTISALTEVIMDIV